MPARSRLACSVALALSCACPIAFAEEVGSGESPPPSPPASPPHESCTYDQAKCTWTCGGVEYDLTQLKPKMFEPDNKASGTSGNHYDWRLCADPTIGITAKCAESSIEHKDIVAIKTPKTPPANGTGCVAL